MLNYYEILGVDENATDLEIKAAFKKKAVQFHPDKHQGDTAMENIFKELNNAYQILSNPYKRARYDMTLKYVAFEVTVEPPEPQRRRPYPPTFHPPVIKREPINSKENLKATLYAFLFAFTVALIIKGGIWTHDYLEAQEFARVMAERREIFDEAQKKYKEGRMVESLEILDQMGGFLRSELDIRDYKDLVLQQMLKEANKYYEQKQYGKALENFELLKKYPIGGSLNIMIKKAEAYKQVGNFAPAIEIFNDMYQMGYRSTSFYYSFAKLYKDGPKNYNRALKYYEIAAKKAVMEYESSIGSAFPVVITASMIPELHYSIYLELSEAYYLTQDYEQTIKSIEWTREIWPDSSFQYILSGKSHLALNQIPSACSEFKIAVSLDPSFGSPISCP